MLQTDCFGYFKIVSFPLLLQDNKKKNFSNIYCENLVKLLDIYHMKQWGSSWLGASGVFKSWGCPYWGSYNYNQLLSLPGTGIYLSILLVNLCSGKLWLPVFACLSLQFESSDLPPNHFYRSLKFLLFQSVQLFHCF